MENDEDIVAAIEAEEMRRAIAAEEARRANIAQRPKRTASYKEFSDYWKGGGLPDDVELSPQQAELIGLSGAIDTAGHGVQQLIAKGLGAKKWEEAIARSHTAKKSSVNKAREIHPEAVSRGEFVGDVATQLPFVPIGMAGKGMILSPALAVTEGALWGGTQYTEPGQNKLMQMAVPGSVSGLASGTAQLLSPAVTAIGKRFGKFENEIGKDIIKPKGIKPEYEQKMLNQAKERVKAGKELGVELTPAEAMGSPIVAKEQASLGQSAKGTTKLEEHWRGPKGRYEAENKAVNDFFKELGVDPDKVSPEASRKIRDAADDIIQEQLKNRKSLAKPIYKRAAKEEITDKTSQRLMLDENIRDSANNLYKKPEFKEASKKIEPNSIERWDLVKRNIDDKINSAFRSGDTNKARLLMQSKTKLINELDKVSPKYKAARKVFSNESEVLEELYGSNLGKLANLDDKQLSNVSKILFDPQEIDSKTLQLMRDKLLKQNPRAYNDALANNIKMKMDKIGRTATGRDMPAFYKAVTANDKNYNMYMDALKHNPKAQKRLTAVKTAFQDLSGDFTPRTVAGMEKAGVLDKRNWMTIAKDWISKGGAYDEAAIKFITDPNWIAKADAIANMPDGFKKSEAAAKLLQTIANAKAEEKMRKK